MYDVFLSFSGEHRHIVETYLYKELIRSYPEHKVFYDKDSISYGDRISAKVVGEAQRCNIFVAVLSEEYFTRSRSPMMELAASYSAFKEENSGGVPIIFPVFLALKPEHVKDRIRQREWSTVWKKWENDDRMCMSNVDNRPSRVEPAVWIKAVSHTAALRGKVYEPQEYKQSESLFMRAVAESVHSKLGMLNQPAQVRAQPYKATALQTVDKTEIGQSSNHPGSERGLIAFVNAEPYTCGLLTVARDKLFWERKIRVVTSGKLRLLDSTDGCTNWTRRADMSFRSHILGYF